ncbi:hypothetical protein GQ457_02G011100 [Hibiscus cannabinus]
MLVYFLLYCDTAKMEEITTRNEHLCKLHPNNILIVKLVQDEWRIQMLPHLEMHVLPPALALIPENVRNSLGKAIPEVVPMKQKVDGSLLAVYSNFKRETSIIAALISITILR